jgi:hypothetical protein
MKQQHRVKPLIKPQNPVARAVSVNPAFRSRVVPLATVYSRKDQQRHRKFWLTHQQQQ